MLSRVFGFGRRSFDSLSEQEILALAISSEEDDSRIYRAYADGVRDEFPQSAKMFDAMAAEEDGHRAALIDLHRARFGESIPLIRREHVRGFYEEAAKRTSDASTRRLLGDLAAAEGKHEAVAHSMEQTHVPEDVQDEERTAERRQFILTYVQPGLAGLMDGSVSTLAPIFAAAFATGDTWQTFLVGLSASVGAGISMGFTEAAHDDGKLSGRGSPLKRGLASGIMTAVGGLGHALPYLIPNFWTATTVAAVVVFVELWAIAFIQNRYMETPFLRATFQVVLGGALVFAAGVLIGSA